MKKGWRERRTKSVGVQAESEPRPKAPFRKPLLNRDPETLAEVGLMLAKSWKFLRRAFPGKMPGEKAVEHEYVKYRVMRSNESTYLK